VEGTVSVPRPPLRAVPPPPKVDKGIKLGEYVCCAERQIFDAKVKEVGDNALTVETADGDLKLKKTYLGDGKVVSFKGPRVNVEDLHKGKEVEFKFKEDDADLSRGQIDGQTNSEVCLRQINDNSASKSQSWIPREDIRFLYVMVFSASSLKNTDIGVNNKSDPYVVVHLRKSGGKPNASTDDLGGEGHDYHMTHYVNNDLNPTWNMDFKFLSLHDVEAVVFTVWDKDINLFKSDDFLGRAELTKDTWEARKDEVLELPLLDMEKKPMFGETDAKESKLKVRVKICGPRN